MPRTTNKKIFAGKDKSGFLDILAAARGNPNGREKSKVKKKIFIETKEPSSIVKINLSIFATFLRKRNPFFR